MASISYNKANGTRRILFTAPDGSRKAIRPGKVNQRQADTILLFIEDLVSCQFSGTSPKAATAQWVAGLPDVLRRRLERAELIRPQARVSVPSLKDWIVSYIAGRTDIKAGSVICLENVKRNLIDRFGPDKLLDEITAGDAEDFRIYLDGQGLSESTLRRRCKTAKQFFAAAMRKKIIAENPFAGIRCTNYANAERFAFVGKDAAQAVLDACPDAEWRLVFALCRYGGLRCPTELLRLTWADVNWEKSRFTVHASKTEHHDGGGVRVVPIFPELYPYLLEVFEQAEPGTANVITRYRYDNQNLRTQLGRIIKNAGLVPWPKLFQNLRSTRETELCETFPAHVVCKWLGNSQTVAAKHYLQVTEDHYQKAAQKAAQHPAVGDGKGQKRTGAEEQEPAICGAFPNNATPSDTYAAKSMGPQGFEPWTKGL